MTPAERDALPLVAVVTPVYNGAAFLRETMECVQAQTYPNLVHVVLDNASTDETPAIIAEYQDRKVPVVTARNPELLPQAVNWNRALELAPAEATYLRLLCADDTMSPTCTEKMVEVAESDPDTLLVGVDVVLGDAPLPFGWPKNETVMDGAELVRGFFRNEMGFFAVHMLMRRSVMEWRNPIYDEDFGPGIDFEMVLGILKRGKFGMVHEELGWVRLHEGSETSRVMLKKNTHFADWLKALYRHGPDVFSPEEFRRIARRYERHYIRRALRWRLTFGEEAAKPHFQRLTQERGPVTALDFLDACGDALLIRLGLRKHWSGWPN